MVIPAICDILRIIVPRYAELGPEWQSRPKLVMYLHLPRIEKYLKVLIIQDLLLERGSCAV